MSYQRKVYVLRYDDSTPYPGLTVRLRGLSIDSLMKVGALADMPDEPTAEDLARLEPVWEILGNGLISWDLTDENDDPVPVAGFRDEDFGMLLSILMQWVDAVGGVSVPKELRSSVGRPFRAESIIPVVPLSPSRAS